LFAPVVLDLGRIAAYIAAHDDDVCSIKPPPPPCTHGTGVLSRLNVPVPPDFGRGTFFLNHPALLAFVR